MNKNFKKAGALLLTALIGTSAFAGCGGAEGSFESSDDVYASVVGSIDKKNATKYDVVVYEGGYGAEWAKTLAAELMGKFANVSLESGKTGLFINIIPLKGDGMPNVYEDILFPDQAQADLYITSERDPAHYFQNEVTYDITDILMEEVYDANGEMHFDANGNVVTQQGGKRLYDMLDPYFQTHWNYGTEQDPKYYFLPFEDTACGFNIDWDLISDPVDGILSTVQEFTGLGDAEKGYMPGNYEEWMTMLNELRANQLSAFAGKPGLSWYWRSFDTSIRSKVNGVEKSLAMEWHMDDPEGYDFNDDGAITDDEKITFDPNDPSKTNVYMVTKTKGYKATAKYAMDLMTISGGRTYYDTNFKQNVDFGKVQSDFLLSKYSTGDYRKAMIYEGEWWENEARATFAQMGGDDVADGWGARDFRMMPAFDMSSVTGQPDAESKYVLTSVASGSLVVVNPDIKNSAVRKKLTGIVLQYFFSNHGLATLTSTTSICMPSYKYTMKQEELAKMTKYGQWMRMLHSSDDVIYQRYSAVDLYRTAKGQAITNRFIRNTRQAGAFGNQWGSVSWVHDRYAQDGIDPNDVTTVDQVVEVQYTDWYNYCTNLE